MTQEIAAHLVSEMTPAVAKTIGGLLDPMTRELLRDRAAIKAAIRLGGEDEAESMRLAAIDCVLRERCPLLPLP